MLLRIIHLNNGTIAQEDRIINTNTEVNLIDKPLYVTIQNIGYNVELTFHYGSNSEKKCQYCFDNLKIEYGITSGKVYSVILPSTGSQQGNYFKIKKDVEKRFLTPRGKNNMRAFLEIVELLVPLISSMSNKRGRNNRLKLTH